MQKPMPAQARAAGLEALRAVEPQLNRPRPTMPKMAEIVAFWNSSEDCGDLFATTRDRAFGWGEPFCFRCGWVVPSKDAGQYPEWWDADRSFAAAWEASRGWLERAHLHDHVFGGSADPENLVPLCVLCHEEQPRCQTRADGIAFVASRCPRAGFMLFFQMATAQMGAGKSRPKKDQALRTLLRAQAAIAVFKDQHSEAGF